MKHCGRSTVKGHGENAICGQPYYFGTYQCDACRLADTTKPLTKEQLVNHFVADILGIKYDADENYSFPSPDEYQEFAYLAAKVWELVK